MSLTLGVNRKEKLPLSLLNPRFCLQHNSLCNKGVLGVGVAAMFQFGSWKEVLTSLFQMASPFSTKTKIPNDGPSIFDKNQCELLTNANATSDTFFKRNAADRKKRHFGDVRNDNQAQTYYFSQPKHSLYYSLGRGCGADMEGLLTMHYPHRG